MAGRPPDDMDLQGFVRQHAPDLHRTALMLTADPDRADALLAGAIDRASHDPASHDQGPGHVPDPDQVRAHLVRDFLRTARRRRWDRPTVQDRSGDPGDILAALPPRARAATVLELVHGWTPAQVAATVPPRPGRGSASAGSGAPSTPGLRDALEGVADRHARGDQEVVGALLARLSQDHPTAAPAVAATSTSRSPSPSASRWTAEAATGPRSSGRASVLRRRWRWLLALTLVLVLTGTGWALTRDGPGLQDSARVDAGPPTAPGLTSRGWVLDASGHAPRGLEGLQLLEELTLDYSKASEPLELRGGDSGRIAKYAVLWCDLPAVDDPNLVIPTLTLDFSEGPVRVPCAGREGQPPVTQLTPAPYGSASPQAAQVSWEGDLPGRGMAVLAFYHEGSEGDIFNGGPPLTSAGTDNPAPPVPSGSVPITTDAPATTNWYGRAYVQKVEIGPDSTVSAWVGTSAALSILVDGWNVTDDGDLAAYGGPTPSNDHWRSQDAELRDGAWIAYQPEQTKTFELPDEVRPKAGERRTVVVTVLVHGDLSADRHWQAWIDDATALTVRDSVVPLATAAETTEAERAPEYVGGYRRIAQWEVAADGYPHRLEQPAGSLATVMFVTTVGPEQFPGYGYGPFGAQGSVESDFGTAPLSLSYDVVENFSYVQGDAWTMPRPDRLEPGGLRASLPSMPGQPTMTVWAYQAVDYADFDFDDAPPLTSSWPASDEHLDLDGQGYHSMGLLFPGDGLSLDLRRQPQVARITTHGRGQLRLMIDGEPVREIAPDRDGWWSSWTSEAVVSEVYLADAVRTAFGELTVEVEGYDEDLEIEIFSN